MIDILTKIHDRFSIEFKMGFRTRPRQRSGDFSVYMWIFLPNSLDINPSTYPKSKFYSDVKSNVRLITPKFALHEIAAGEALPLRRLEAAFTALAASPSRETTAEYEYRIKMFAAIVKSALRDEINCIRRNRRGAETTALCRSYMRSIARITGEFHRLHTLLETPDIPEETRNCYRFVDEFLCDIIARHTLALLRHLEAQQERRPGIVRELAATIRKGERYGTRMGYEILRDDDPRRNRALVFRSGVLKKYVESALFLKAPKKRDGVVVEQLYYSIAAGLSMIFATVVSFSFQQRFGNFTTPLFIALVVSYMLKDRIKDLMRYYFAHRIGSSYFDNKATMRIKEQPIGWIKEGVDFLSEQKVPPQVMSLRSRSPLLQAENRISDEKIILYRKSVHIDRSKLDRHSVYATDGINDIIRLHVSNFIRKMDDPQVTLYTLGPNDRPEAVVCDKVYFLNVVLQYRYDERIVYKRFRIAMTRAGSDSIDELE